MSILDEREASAATAADPAAVFAQPILAACYGRDRATPTTYKKSDTWLYHRFLLEAGEHTRTCPGSGKIQATCANLQLIISYAGSLSGNPACHRFRDQSKTARSDPDRFWARCTRQLLTFPSIQSTHITQTNILLIEPIDFVEYAFSILIHIYRGVRQLFKPPVSSIDLVDLGTTSPQRVTRFIAAAAIRRHPNAQTVIQEI